ncbi:hypothetical protein EYC84_003132 [Monilinia fructicola]|uniref:Uncharacterized protein n=1 Tax=Monilinia fructicola TaxID=38448 RepID=A0A5M9JSP2_MONFR|nr:hypothetical protein EYC84_003132 [Monilinia fructicola]
MAFIAIERIIVLIASDLVRNGMFCRFLHVTFRSVRSVPINKLGAYGMKIDMDSKSLSQGLLLNPIFDFCTVSLTQRNRILSPITVWDISKSIPPSHSQLEMLCPNP